MRPWRESKGKLSPSCSRKWSGKPQKKFLAVTMGMGLTADQAAEDFSQFCNVVGSFYLAQGSDPNGNLKARRKYNFSEIEKQSCKYRLQKAPMSSVNTVEHVSTDVGGNDGGHPINSRWETPKAASEDMRGACRQVSLAPAHVSLASMAMFYPSQNQQLLHPM